MSTVSTSNLNLSEETLKKLVVPPSNGKESQLFEFFTLFHQLIAQKPASFPSGDEFYSFSYSLTSTDALYHQILQYLIEILIATKHQMISRYTDTESLYENSTLVSEFLYMQRRLDLQIRDRLASFNFTSGYFSIHLLDKYLWWINTHIKYDENTVGYLTLFYSRLEDLCQSSTEAQFLESITSSDKLPHLLKEHYMVLKLFNRYILQLLEEERTTAGSPDLVPFINKLETSTLLNQFLVTSPESMKDEAVQKILENCASVFTNVIGLLKVHFYSPQSMTTTILGEELIETMNQVVMTYVNEKSKFLEAAYIILEMIRATGLRNQALELAPDLISRYFAQDLPHIDCYNPHESDVLWKVPVSESIFMLLDPNIYSDDPKEGELCLKYILNFFQGINQILATLNKEFLEFGFKPEVIHKPLRNQLYLCKLKSNIHRIGVILKKALPLVQSVIHDLLSRKETSKLEIFYREAETMFLNPLFHFLNQSYRTEFLRTIKGAYMANASSFSTGTIDRVYEAFLLVTSQLKEAIVANAGNESFMNTLSTIMAEPTELLIRISALELEAVGILGPQVISCLLTLEGIYRFFNTLFEGYETSISPSILSRFVAAFGDMLSLSHILDNECNSRLMFSENKPTESQLEGEAQQKEQKHEEKPSEFTKSMYTLLFSEHFCAGLIAEQSQTIESLLAVVESFLVQNLLLVNQDSSLDQLTLQNWSKQVTAFLITFFLYVQ